MYKESDMATGRGDLVLVGDIGGQEANTYSSSVAFLYIFNLIVGVGVLALPKAFNNSGLALGTVLLLILAVMSYVSACYVVECMSAANAFEKMRKRRERVNILSQTKTVNSKVRGRSNSQLQSHHFNGSNGDSLDSNTVEESVNTIPPYCVDVSGVHDPDSKEEDVNITEVTPLLELNSDSEILHLAPTDNDFQIKVKYELGSMATMFYPKFGVVLYYICICLYLFGDLSIYAVTAPASITRVLCNMYVYYDTKTTNDTNGTSGNESFWMSLEDEEFDGDTCFPGLHKIHVYYMFLVVFFACIGPFTFFNMSKTKLMQITTAILRYLAFLMMISLAIVKIDNNVKHDTTNTPRTAEFTAFPSLFGVTIYSFMCQHSLPGMVTPMSSKRYIYRVLMGDFILILIFYYLLVYTGVFAFPAATMQDLYSLDFFTPGDPIWKLIFGIYLALFPVFTLSASFPIISVTLRENLKSLARMIFQEPKVKSLFKLDSQSEFVFPVLIDRILFPLLALTPPLIIAFSTQQIGILVSITGSFPGVGVQYIIPATLVLMVQWKFRESFGKYKSPFQTPLSHVAVIVIVLIWSFLSVVLIIIDLIIKRPKPKSPF